MEAGCDHSHVLTFTCGKNHGLRESLLVLSCATLGKSDTGKVKLFFLPSSICLFSDFFVVVPMVCRNFSAGLLNSHKESCLWVIVRINVQCGSVDYERNSYSDISWHQMVILVIYTYPTLTIYLANISQLQF